jgi:hypothetical protein
MGIKLLGLAGALLAAGAIMKNVSAQQPSTSSAPAEHALVWKCAWPFGIAQRTAADAGSVVKAAKAVGFNALAVGGGTPEFNRAIMPAGRANGMAIFWVLNPIYGEWGWHQEPGVTLPTVDCLQEYEDLATLNTAFTPDDVVYAGPWLCPDRPETRKFAADMARACIKNYGPDGLAIDFVGYKNLKGCECAYSLRQRAEFAKAHPEFSTEQAAREFSLASMTALYDEVRQAALAGDPKIKLAAHVYPPFEYEPMYGNRLAVDYPAQTVSWFFAPHWPMEKVADRCRQIKRTESEYHDYVMGTAFIGIYSDEKNVKPPKRIHEELRAIKHAGVSGFCVAGDMSFLTDTPQTRALSEELGGTLHLQPATSTAPARP